ncbi:MAG: cohesin domain-containing protein, partial [Candidatus Poribacteria bacterium]|nr:cohesin domain-containing protein [Candidatus Poribacteria bacterium]
VKSSVSKIGGIAIADGKIYLAEQLRYLSDGSIVHRANLNGTNLEIFVTSLGKLNGITVDTDADKVYWANSYGGIQRMDINGGEIENVVYGIAAPGDLALGTAVPSMTPTTPETPATTDAVVSISPASVGSSAVGERLGVSFKITGGEAVAGYQATVQFDETTLRYVSSANGDFLPAGAFFVPPVVEGNFVKLNAVSLAGESSGDGTLATLTFEVIAVKASTLMLSDVLLTNSAGEAFVPTIENAQITETTQLKGDINGDGIVNIQDLVLVAGRLGQTGTSSADVNGDGIVNIQDLVLVAGALGTSASAPSLNSQVLEMLIATEVKQWLSAAQQLDLTDTTSQRGILFLQQLLVALTPKETALLPNYPNPFNPETWIPYQLAKDADVTLHIYAMNGTLVRALALGHQAAGMYQNRSRAAYWDGKNEFGESVASGVYFYTLTAGDFSATRKMLIRK